MHAQYFCKVRKTGEIYLAYRAQLISTICWEKNLSPTQAEALLEVSNVNAPLQLAEEDVWKGEQSK